MGVLTNTIPRNGVSIFDAEDCKVARIQESAPPRRSERTIMRDPDRIDHFCEVLHRYWKEKIPDWRFGQFMYNFLGWVAAETKRDVFFFEEDEMLVFLDRFFEANIPNDQ